LKKKQPFRRTKDKSIKYNVHEKMVGFMAPTPSTRELDDEATEKIFKNLFGGIPQYYENKIKTFE
jgi:hypothetical protein